MRALLEGIGIVVLVQGIALAWYAIYVYVTQ